MGTEDKTPAEKAGLVVGGIYVGYDFGHDCVAVLREDDGTDTPCFSIKHLFSDEPFDDYMFMSDIVGCFSDPFNPPENEIILLAISLGLDLEELKVKIELAKKISKEVLEKI